MAPVLDRVASDLEGRMAIGKIDCTVDKSFCSEFQVRGYPTLKFSLDGQIHDYPGGRNEAEIIAFANKINKPDVHLIPSVADANKYLFDEADDGLAFLAYHPELHGDALDNKLASTLVTQVYAQVARTLKASGHFLLLDSAMLEGGEFEASIASLGQKRDKPFVCRLERHVVPRCYGDDMESITKGVLMDYVQVANVPTVSQLGPTNFNKIGRRGRPLVIGVASSGSENSDELSQIKKVLAQYATTGAESIRDKYYYGWFDGKMWAKFLVQVRFEEKLEHFASLGDMKLMISFFRVCT